MFCHGPHIHTGFVDQAIPSYLQPLILNQALPPPYYFPRQAILRTMVPPSKEVIYARPNAVRRRRRQQQQHQVASNTVAVERHQHPIYVNTAVTSAGHRRQYPQQPVPDLLASHMLPHTQHAHSVPPLLTARPRQNFHHQQHHLPTFSSFPPLLDDRSYINKISPEKFGWFDDISGQFHHMPGVFTDEEERQQQQQREVELGAPMNAVFVDDRRFWPRPTTTNIPTSTSFPIPIPPPSASISERTFSKKNLMDLRHSWPPANTDGNLPRYYINSSRYNAPPAQFSDAASFISQPYQAALLEQQLQQQFAATASDYYFSHQARSSLPPQYPQQYQNSRAHPMHMYGEPDMYFPYDNVNMGFQ